MSMRWKPVLLVSLVLSGMALTSVLAYPGSGSSGNINIEVTEPGSLSTQANSPTLINGDSITVNASVFDVATGNLVDPGIIQYINYTKAGNTYSKSYPSNPWREVSLTTNPDQIVGFYFSTTTDKGRDRTKTYFICNEDKDDNDNYCDTSFSGGGTTYKACTQASGNDDNYGGANGLGCVEPYPLDPVEGYLWDSDLSNLLASQGGYTNKRKASAQIFGEILDPKGNLIDGQEDYGTSTSYTEQMFQSVGSESSNSWSLNKYIKTIPSFSPPEGTYSKPNDLRYPRNPKSSNNKCGETSKDSGENNKICPEDYGLPDDKGTTKSTSKTTITEELGTMNGQKVKYINNGQPNINGNNIFCREWGSNGYGNDITMNVDNGDVTKSISKHDTPDYYIASGDSHRLNKVKCIGDMVTVHTTKKDYDLKYDQVVDYSDFSDGSVQTGCKNVVNASCVDNGKTTVCTNPFEGSAEDHKLSHNQYTTTINTKSVYTTPKDGVGYNWEIDNQGGFKVTVKYDDEVVYDGTVDHDTCNEKTLQKKKCAKDNDPSTIGFSCDPVTTDTYSKGYNTRQISDGSSTAKIKIERAKPKDDIPVFNTNPAENPGPSAKQTLFAGDTQKNIQHSSFGGRGYYYASRKNPPTPQLNDEAVSFSKFKIVKPPGTNDFLSKRTNWGTVDVDGQFGGSDGFVLVRKGEIIAEKAVGGKGIGAKAAENSFSPPSAQDIKDRISKGCSKEACIVFVDSQTKKGGWNTPQKAVYTNETTLSPDKGYSVCKKINQMAKQDLMRCDYMYKKNGGKLYKKSPLNVSCEDQSKEQLVSYEGREVRYFGKTIPKGTKEFLAFDQECVNYGKDGSDGIEPQTTQKACVYEGREYIEGTLIDIAHDDAKSKYKFNFERTGGESPDYEVCADIGGNRNPSDNFEPKGGTADAGAQWIDLDDASLNNYLKAHSFQGGNSTGFWFGKNYDSKAAGNPKARKITDVVAGPAFAMEDDCGIVNDNPKISCGDDYGAPYWANFTTKGGASQGVENTTDDDFNKSKNSWIKQQPRNTILKGIHHSVRIQGSYIPPRITDPLKIKKWIHAAHGALGDNRLSDYHYQQDQQPKSLASTLSPWNNSRIDPLDDEWAYSASMTDVIDNRGNPREPGQCYGAEREQGVDKTKAQAVYANSYAGKAYDSVLGKNKMAKMGVWKNPDWTSHSVDKKLTCDLTGRDWGYGFNKPNANLQVINGVKTKNGEKIFTGPSKGPYYAVTGPIAFDDNNGAPIQNGTAQDDKKQWIQACGDDPNEYLIREHENPNAGYEVVPKLTRDNIFVCADRITDCAYNGTVYSQGQRVDVSGINEDEERGDNINDQEVCIDLTSNIPGGEWYDMDNDWMTEVNSQLTVQEWQNVTAFGDPKYFGYNPGTDRDVKKDYLRGNISKFNYSTGNWIQDTDHVTGSDDYVRVGYATEDDCDPDLEACDDVGPDLSSKKWFNAGNFSAGGMGGEGAQQDNYDTNFPYKGVHNRMQDRSDQFEPGAATEENWDLDSVPMPNSLITDLKDSTPGPDNWSLSNSLNNSISNNGTSYNPGQCYARNSGGIRTTKTDFSVSKVNRIFGNSYAASINLNGKGANEGVWIDPDNYSDSQFSQVSRFDIAKWSCDLTGWDKGYGVSNGSDPADTNKWIWKGTGDQTPKSDNSRNPHDSNDLPDSRIVIGNIAFSSVKGKKHPYIEQEPQVCGDDSREFLLEELGESPNSRHSRGRWACGTNRADCVSRADNGNAVYRHGDYIDTSEKGEDYGRYKKDKEVCDLRTSGDITTMDRYGTWYDQDLTRTYCRENILYGNKGVRWVPFSYTKKYPHAVKQGVDDDLNPLLAEEYRNNASLDMIKSTQGDVSEFKSSGGTPIPTGMAKNKDVPRYGNDAENNVATKGFCGGDDGSEYLVTQDCKTRLCETKRQVQGVAKNPGSCVFDGDDSRLTPQDPDNRKRKLYQEGESIVFDINQDQRIMCFGSNWYEDWPIVLDTNNVTVPYGGSTTVSLRVINVENQERTFRLKMFEQSSPSAFTVSRFVGRGNPSKITVPPTSSKQFMIEVQGSVKSLPDSKDNLTISGEAVSGDAYSEDYLNVQIVDQINKSSVKQPKNVPGLSPIYLSLLVL
ncbi:MAG: hypothetical protein ABEJ83_02895, partial [Candidatus Nanohaloarchaea archaeon]